MAEEVSTFEPKALTSFFDGGAELARDANEAKAEMSSAKADSVTSPEQAAPANETESAEAKVEVPQETASAQEKPKEEVKAEAETKDDKKETKEAAPNPWESNDNPYKKRFED